jgi:hypothetical protein
VDIPIVLLNAAQLLARKDGLRKGIDYVSAREKQSAFIGIKTKSEI